MNAFGFADWRGSPVWQSAGQAMLDFLVSGTALAVVLALLRHVSRRFEPTIRYSIACLSMAVLVALAGFHLNDRWPLPQPTSFVQPPVISSQPASSHAAAPFSTTAAPTTPPIAPPPTTPQSTWEVWRPRVIDGMPALWLLGAPLTALFVGLGWTGAARLRRQSTSLTDSTLLSRFDHCQQMLGVRNVTLAVCDRIVAPIVVGILRPAILLPPALLSSLTCDQWQMILLHELAHVRRMDNLVNLLQRGIETVLFFHPAVWWVSKWMRLEREHCCDAVVLKLGTTPQSYAETLAVLALPGIAPQLATAAMANHELLTRMRHILGTEDLPMTISRKKLGLVLAVFAAVGGLVATDWSSRSQRAIADERRENELEDNVLNGVQFDFAAEPREGVDFIRTTRGQESAAALQAAIEEVEQLKKEMAYPSPREGCYVNEFSDKLIKRLRRQYANEGHSIRSGQEPVSFSMKRAWSAEQAIGPPDVPNHSDHQNAWAAKTPDGGLEWLQVRFDGIYEPAAIVIHESFSPGAIKSVSFFRPGEKTASQTVRHESIPGTDKRVTVVRPETQEPVEVVRILIDERKVPGWNEIDAVGLIDAHTGETHWATRAGASSSFGDVPPARDVLVDRDIPLTSAQTAPSWSPQQATGAPNVPQPGDDGRAWASSTQDDSDEWLELTYDSPAKASAVLIFESFNPGAVKSVTVRHLAGQTASTWSIVAPRRQPGDKRGVTVITVPDAVETIDCVRIELDSKSVAGWNEIDAVGLPNAATGQVQWATGAKASSWFGESTPGIGLTDVLITPPPIPSKVVAPYPAVEQAGSWAANQATGAPNVREPGDNPRAWASATPDGQPEWLELTYDPPVLAASMAIYESFNPGAISELQIEEVDPIAGALPPGEAGFRTLMKGNQLYKQGRNGLGITLVTVKTNIRPIRRIKLLIDSPAVQGWNEIDAVGLLSTTGEMHWASSARASSEYGKFASTVQGGLEIRDVSGLVVPPSKQSAPGAQVPPSDEVTLLDVGIGLPVGSLPATPAARQLNVYVGTDGRLIVDGRRLSRDRLLQRISGDPDLRISLFAEAECPFRTVVALYDACKEAGANEIELQTPDTPPEGDSKSSP